MKLYNVPNQTLVRVLPQPVEEIENDGQMEINFADPNYVHVPPAAPEIGVDEYIYFDHIDGMYSFCFDEDGNIVHMAAWTEVEPVELVRENFEILRTRIKRGGRGKNGDRPLTHVNICDMSNEWLDNTITYEEKLRPDNRFLPLYRWEQEYRKENGIFVEDKA